jgi:FMN reductase
LFVLMPSVVAISGSPSATSKSRRLAEYANARFADAGAATALVDLCGLPADGLLGRSRPQGLVDALQRVGAADVVIASTPVYRAAYSGLLKVFFDLLPQDALAGKVGLPIVTGASPAHQLAVDHALRPLFASVGALVVSNAVYATDSELGADGPSEHVLRRLDRGVDEALALLSTRR